MLSVCLDLITFLTVSMVKEIQCLGVCVEIYAQRYTLHAAQARNMQTSYQLLWCCTRGRSVHCICKTYVLNIDNNSEITRLGVCL
jgi:hypothetical protein